VETKNVPQFLAGPVQARLCDFSKVDEPGLGLDFFCDLNEILAVQYENEYRAHKAAEQKRNKR
jgi:hypothetical protein